MAGQRRGTSVDVDAEAFLRDLKQAVRQLELRSTQGLQRVGIRVQRAAKELCPVDTGRLRASIAVAPGQDGRGPFVDIGTNVDYAPHIEFGTSRAPAQPYLRPAVAEAVGYTARTVAGGS